MNPQQQEQCLELRPLAYTIARDYEDREEAQSVAQLALCEAVESWDATRAPLARWAAVHIRNRLREWRRKEGKHKHMPLRDEDLACEDPEPSELRELIPLLPSHLRSVARRKWLDHWPAAYIAEALTLSPSTVYARLKDAAEWARLLRRHE